MRYQGPERRERTMPRLDLDVRGILALVSLLSSLVILGLLIVREELDGPTSLAFLGTLAGPVMGFYFGAKGASVNEQVVQEQRQATAQILDKVTKTNGDH